MRLVDIFFEIQQNPEAYIKKNKNQWKEVYCWYNETIQSVYIGMGNLGRHNTHQHDLLSIALKSDGWKCRVITGLSNKNAEALEAWLIKQGESLMGLTPSGTYNVIPGKMINKQRELNQERLISKCLKV